MDNRMTFTTEADFEQALINVLRSDKGWGEHEVIKNPTEDDLLQNWAKILFNNNKDIDRLNNVPLTTSEMQQILEQINTLKTPLKLNKTVKRITIVLETELNCNTIIIVIPANAKNKAYIKKLWFFPCSSCTPENE